MIVNIYNGVVRDIFSQFSDLDDARVNLPKDMHLEDAPSHVTLGWSYSDGVWTEPTRSGFKYDPELKILVAHEEYRRILHSRTDPDVLEAQRKIREGDTSYDWQGWLNRLDAYNKAVSDTKNQPTYPDKVDYPEYPSR